jgi:hypothetical protein
MAELVFDAEQHKYFVDGVEYPSVSEIIKPLGDDVDDTDLELVFEAAAERGTLCHWVLEQLLNGVTEFEYPSSYESYIDAIRLFVSEHEIIPIAIETPIYSLTEKMAGTPDLLCYFDDVLTIVDYKFVSQIAKVKVKAQLNAYQKMYTEQGVYPDQLLAVQFLNDGGYRIYPVKIDNTEIKLCLQIYDLKHKKHSRGKID